MLCLAITMPTSFWFHADSDTRYGLWHQCVTTRKPILFTKNIEFQNTISNSNENLNQKVQIDSKLVCSIYNKGK